MNDRTHLDMGRMVVVSAKVGEGMVSVIDGEARAKIMARATWFREAILEKLIRDGAIKVERPDPFNLAEVLG